MTAILSLADYDMVRAALGVEIDESVVSDEMIALPIHQGAAEAEIVRRDPLALSRVGNEAIHVQAAAVYLTAALIAPAMTRMKRESFGDYSYAAQEDWDKREKDLRARYEREMAAVLNPTTVATSTRPTMFSVASAHRGR